MEKGGIVGSDSSVPGFVSVWSFGVFVDLKAVFFPAERGVVFLFFLESCFLFSFL